MPSEYCRECNSEADVRRRRDAAEHPTRIRHHGTGCRYSRCTEHCTCTQAEQGQWRVAVRSQRNQVQCSSCHSITNHVCSTDERRNGHRLYTNRRFCGRCCSNSLCRQLVSCAVRNAEPYGQSRLRTCPTCGQDRLAIYFEDGLDSCRACSLRLCVRCLHASPNIPQCEECHCCTPSRELINEIDWGRCCRCESQRTDRPRLYTQVDLKFDHCNSKPHKRNPLLRPIGVEIEIVGFNNPSKEALVNLYNTCVKWNAPIGTDGSLHSESAVEIRTSPASGEAFARQVWEITRAIRAAGGFVNHECGLHVHVDMRGYVPDRYASAVHPGLDCLVEMWALCEREFYKIVALERETRTYSKPWWTKSYGWYQGVDTEETLKTAKYGMMQYRAIRRVDRYSGCNLQSLAKHNTIEYRLHQGTVNTRVIMAWALLCAAFTVQATESQAPAELWQFAKEIGPLRYLQWLAPTRDARKYITYLRSRTPQQVEMPSAAQSPTEFDEQQEEQPSLRARWEAERVHRRLMPSPYNQSNDILSAFDCGLHVHVDMRGIEDDPLPAPTPPIDARLERARARRARRRAA